MEVKTFEAYSMRDAIKAVKNEFGHDAVILRTSEKRTSDGRVFEVVASPAGQAQRVGASMTGIMQGDSIRKSDLLDWSKILTGLKSDLKNLESRVVQRNDLDRLESSIHEIKNLLRLRFSDRNEDLFGDLQSPLTDLMEKLRLMDVDQSLLVELARFLRDLDASKLSSSDKAFDFYQAHAVRWCLRRIKIAQRWTTESDQDQIHIFIGSSGAGKTSLLCKLAHNLKIKENCEVLLASGDLKRLGANEQLRVFAKVSDLDFKSISSPIDLATILSKNPGNRSILVDTPGLSPKNESIIAELKAYRDLSIPVHFHLCLSMAEKCEQIERSIRAFSFLGIDSLMFTRLDETWSYGEMLNTSLRWGIPLSFFGTGQKIPDDLERASRERVVERIFGL